MNNKATILYIPHGGGPLPLLDEAGHTSMNNFLRGFPATIAKPDAIVVISAHWEDPVIAITAGRAPPLLFDYYGFPPETYQYEYPASGLPELSERAGRLIRQAGINVQLDAQRGFDHGLFIPLLLMYPRADIPCIQISLSSSLDAALHVRIGRALADLKSENLLVLGSGFSFHNMKALMSKADDLTDEKNQAFETWLARTCSDTQITEADRESRLVHWEQAPHARYCHPREEHLLPLHVCYGIGRSAAKLVFQDKVSGFMTSAYQW